MFHRFGLPTITLAAFRVGPIPGPCDGRHIGALGGATLAAVRCDGGHIWTAKPLVKAPSGNEIPDICERVVVKVNRRCHHANRSTTTGFRATRIGPTGEPVTRRT